jgi:hypothetical protein
MEIKTPPRSALLQVDLAKDKAETHAKHPLIKKPAQKTDTTILSIRGIWPDLDSNIIRESDRV